MSKNFKQFSKAIWENYEVVEEENKPTNPELWSRAKSMAKKKFDVYPSAYANGWAAKWYKSKGGGWRSVSEEIEPEKKDEYDGEVDMAKNQLRRIISHAQHFHDMLTDKDQNLPEWVQSKVTKAEDYISTAHDYMMGEMQEETISESLGNHGALTNYANSSKAGIDKKDFHTAAKHMKSGHLNKLKTHLANMDTDPRDHVIKHIDKKHHKALGYHMSEATYTAVHAKHGKKTVQADSTYGAAKAAASHWNTGKKGTQGIDVHLHTDKPKAYTEAVVRLNPKTFLKVKGPSSAYDAGYTAAKSGKKYGENPHPRGSKEHLDWSKAHNQARVNKIHGEEVDLEEGHFEITYKHPQYNKPRTHTIKAKNADHAQTKFLSYGNPYKVHSVKKVNEASEEHGTILLHKYHQGSSEDEYGSGGKDHTQHAYNVYHKKPGQKAKLIGDTEHNDHNKTGKTAHAVSRTGDSEHSHSSHDKAIAHVMRKAGVHPATPIKHIKDKNQINEDTVTYTHKDTGAKMKSKFITDVAAKNFATQLRSQQHKNIEHHKEEADVPALLKKEGYYKDIATNKAEDERLAKQKKTNYPPHMNDLLKKARAYDKKHPLPKNEAVTKTIKPGQGYKMEESALSRVMGKLKDIETRKSFETGQSRIPTPDERRRQLSKKASVVKEAAKKKKQKPETFEAEPELTSDVQIKSS